MNPIVMPMVVALAVSAVSIALYDRFVVRPAMVIGIVNLGEVYRQKEAEFTLILTLASSDGEREKAMLMARAFAQRLPLALEELPARERQSPCTSAHPRTLTTGPVDT